MGERVHRAVGRFFVLALGLYVAVRLIQSVLVWLVAVALIATLCAAVVTIARYRRSHW